MVIMWQSFSSILAHCPSAPEMEPPICRAAPIRPVSYTHLAADFELLCHTPSSALGSCRYKMPSPDKGPEQYAKILEMFRKYNIGYFAYIGGNDSMDTANKIADYCYEHGEEVRVVRCV